MNEKWYVVNLLMQCQVGDKKPDQWTCDEQIRLIRAGDNAQAYQKAFKLGQAEEHSYKNEADETVRWEFVGVEDLEELLDETIEDGVEIKSRIFTHDNPSALIRSKTLFLTLQEEEIS